MITELVERLDYSQEDFLSHLLMTKEPVNIFLVNGIRLHGAIGGHDQVSVLLDSASPQIIYKHAISTIMLATHQGSKE